MRKVGKIAPIETEEDQKIVEALYSMAEGDKHRQHILKCIDLARLTLNLQDFCRPFGKENAGRFLQREPLVIQCHSCHENFSEKPNVDFAGATVNLGSLQNIVWHLLTCRAKG